MPSWNVLAVELCLCTSLSTFKRLLKETYTIQLFLINNLTHRTLSPGSQNAAAQTVDLDLLLYFDYNELNPFFFKFYSESFHQSSFSTTL